jgi:hypothetical protein
MFLLFDTMIAFIVIMLVLSLLVKSLTSVFKNHVDYYSKNLEMEVIRLINGTIEGGIKKLGRKSQLLDGIQWKRLGEEFLTKQNIEWLLRKLGASEESLQDLEARLEVHKANVRYAFEKRTKNISLVLGLALCLGLNINALTIWDTLYSDQKIRAKFSSQQATKFALEKAEKELEDTESIGNDSSAAEADTQREALQKERAQFLEEFYSLRSRVKFGIGTIYTQSVDWWPGLIYEFLGSLLTGILVSIGAPYWHDLLRAFSELRKPKSAKPVASV